MNLLLFQGLIAALITVTRRSFNSRLHEDRIVGGEITTIEKYPYTVSLILADGYPWCGGSILNSSVIVTTARCAEVGNMGTLQVQAGSNFTNTNGTLRNITKIFVHERYNSTTLDYDVALLVLKEPLILSNKIQPISLPNTTDYLANGNDVNITGWGNTQEGGVYSTVLRKVELPVVEQYTCKYMNSDERLVTPRMLCSGLILMGGKAACDGDWGCPVVSNGKLHGIVSWAVGCARPEHPGVNTRVTAIREWIRSKVNI